MYEVATVPFRDTPGILSLKNFETSEIYAVPRNICQMFGIDSKTQQRRLGENPARWGYKTIWVQLPGDDRKRNLAVIPNSKVRSWISSINPEKVKPEIRENLIAFQQECDQVLYDYWTKGIAINPRTMSPITKEFQEFIGAIVKVSIKEAISEFAHTISAAFVDKKTFLEFAEKCDTRLKNLEKKSSNEGNTTPLLLSSKINIEQAEMLRSLVKEKGKERKRICQIWKKFRQKFKLEKYGDLPEKNFQEALRWVNQL